MGLWIATGIAFFASLWYLYDRRYGLAISCSILCVIGALFMLIKKLT